MAVRINSEKIFRPYFISIFLKYDEKIYGDKDKGEQDSTETKVNQINSASAFWKGSKSSLKEKDYNEFYKSISNDNEDPLHTIHTQAEGTLDYSTLFYIPKKHLLICIMLNINLE